MLKALAEFELNVCIEHDWHTYMGETWCENCEHWADGTPTAMKGKKK